MIYQILLCEKIQKERRTKVNFYLVIKYGIRFPQPQNRDNISTEATTPGADTGERL